ncbi:phosphoribosylanthranilate isomerase [Ruminiclostridium herbifermentans]|uniref:N-(5'-phosphoribosyl)anthranilate isomerase n=1 Tax=Ruminiclostridium herbifermentans TaxID=2488810 RepID=A0A4U7JF49_9FIRM|nr:phosphoribosylanthranilate isomerase [Ruminiclostridium herbifermentans]QNU67398.1 phosphoribosylanthranilate isomerase [Ruminiclostridium herbifermentans]
MTKIKICGLTRMQDIEYVNEALPDFIGFVFAKSRRQVNPDTAYQLKSALDYRIKAVGVFVNESISVIKQLCQSNIIDYIQLHGDEDEEYIKNLSCQINTPIIKAVRVKDLSSIVTAQQLSGDFLLLDTFSDKEYGGTGKTFDWKLAKYIEKPFFLAGGINYCNAKAAIDSSKPYCLDVSSGVETNGVKDRNKIIDIVSLVRSNFSN